MVLKKITLDNFRQFYNKQTIEFAQGEKNITIIFGTNGQGKTGIFRALIFSLFGEKYLNQDDIKGDIHLINWNKLEENRGDLTQGLVEVEFEFKKKNYKVTRNISAFKENNLIREQIGNAELEIRDEEGNIQPPICDEKEINEEIYKVINREVKDFFLFDGEKIEDLAKTNDKIRREIKKGITKLLNIDSLEKAISVLSKLESDERKKINSKSSNIDLKKNRVEIEELEEKKEKSNEKLEKNIENLEKCANEIEDYEKKLSENKEINEKQEEIKTKNKEINASEELYQEQRKGLIKNNIASLSCILGQESVANTEDKLKELVSNEKGLIGIAAINKILDEMKCICGNDLNENESAHKKIKLLEKNYERSEISEILNMVSETLKEIKNTVGETSKDLLEGLKKIRNTKDQITIKQREKGKLEEAISQLAEVDFDFNQIEKNLEKLKSDKIKIDININSEKGELEKVEKDLERKKCEEKELLKQDEALKVEYRRVEKIELLEKNFSKLYDEYTKGMRERLTIETIDIFKEIIDPKDRDLLERVDINDKYELNFYNWLGNKITQDISQGQRQMVALSFITALAKVASNGELNKFPLFMDTPFGRISGNNRDNLIEKIPKLTSQWILLLTDTEYTINEDKKMKSGKKLGKCYVLTQTRPGVTEIVEKDINDTIVKGVR